MKGLKILVAVLILVSTKVQSQSIGVFSGLNTGNMNLYKTTLFFGAEIGYPIAKKSRFELCYSNTAGNASETHYSEYIHYSKQTTGIDTLKDVYKFYKENSMQLLLRWRWSLKEQTENTYYIAPFAGLSFHNYYTSYNKSEIENYILKSTNTIFGASFGYNVYLKKTSGISAHFEVNPSIHINESIRSLSDPQTALIVPIRIGLRFDFKFNDANPDLDPGPAD